jgi:hypothetical protein
MIRQSAIQTMALHRVRLSVKSVKIGFARFAAQAKTLSKWNNRKNALSFQSVFLCANLILRIGDIAWRLRAGDDDGLDAVTKLRTHPLGQKVDFVDCNRFIGEDVCRVIEDF